MTVNRFEELYCWQQGRELVKLVYSMTRQAKFVDFSLKDQIQRAAVSVISNIAEGFERSNREEFLYFLYVAKGSCGEVRAQAYVAFDQRFITAEEFKSLISLSERVSAIIYKFIESIKVSEFKGLKHKKTEVVTEEEKFMRKLREKFNIKY
ncbi:MAG: four helix bundle protein [Patescibacteria group bacterium]